MDLHTGLIYVTVVGISVFVIVFVSMFGMKEKSYEEAIAEQRKLPDDHLLMGKKEKGKEKKHKNKTGKKAKEKKEDKEEKEEKVEHPSAVHFEETPIVLPPEPIATETGKGSKKKNKVEKVKPILVNKDDPSVVATEPTEPENLVTEVNHFDRIQPKDSLELIRSHSKERSSLQQAVQSEPIINKSPKDTPSKTRKNVKEPTRKKDETREEKKEAVTESASAPQQQQVAKEVAKDSKEAGKDTTVVPVASGNANPAASVALNANAGVTSAAPVVIKETKESVQASSKETKKSKKKNDILAQIGGDRDGINVSLLMPLVQKAELSRSEIQILIDQLLNKQQDNPSEHSEWTEGRTDPVIKLKKQLAEKEKALSEEHEASLTFQNKLKELRAELNAERSRSSSQIKQLEEALTAKITEAHTLQTRMQHILESHAAEKQGFARQIEQLQVKVNEDAAIIHKMQEEQGQAQGQMQQELITQRKQLEVQFGQMRENENALKSQLAQKHIEIQELQNVNISMTQELQATCESSTAEIEMLRQQLGMMEDQLMHSEGQLQHLKEAGERMQDMARQLEESHRAHADFDHRLKSAHRHEQELQKQIHSLQAELKMSKAEASESVGLKSELGKERAELMKLRAAVNEKDEQLKFFQTERTKLAGFLADDRYELARAQESLENVQKELREEICTHVSVVEELANATSKITKLEHELSTAASNQVAKTENEALQNGDRQITDVQLQVTRLQEENDRISAQLGKFAELQKELKQLREENESLASQLAASTERPAAEGRENGVEDKLLEHTNLLEQKENQLVALKGELANRESELGQVRALVESLQIQVDKQTTAAKRLEEDLEAQRSKNNELRTKNWKVMEALSAAESRVKANTGKSNDEMAAKIKSDEQASTRSLLQRIFPEVKVSEKSYDRWLEAFEAQVEVVLTDLRKQPASEGISELEKRNENLRGMTLQYRQIIDETEGMLMNLQSHMETEESRWESQLREKETEIANLRIELKELQQSLAVSEKLQQKITELEARLAEEENLREKTKAEILALREANKHSAEKVSSQEFCGSEKLHMENNKRVTRDVEVIDVGSKIEKPLNEQNPVSRTNKDTISQTQNEVSRLNAEIRGASDASEQSIENGPATSDSSKSEPSRATDTLIAALEKTLLKNADNENSSVSDDTASFVQSQREHEDSSLTTETNSQKSHEAEHNTQASWNPLNGQHQKKHKKKRKGGSGKK